MSSLETPTVEGSYRIMPSDIDCSRHFFSAFGEAEVEFSAKGLVLYCQEKGSWVPFTKDELTDFFRAAKAAGREFPDHDTRLFPSSGRVTKRVDIPYAFMSSKETRLLAVEPPDTFKFFWLRPKEGLLVRKGDDGKYRVTELFIERCHRSSPKLPSLPTT